ncbi:hypothetical protein F5887DRAFT_1289437 [Amanita rubescens]|nr:hypothetical protein F5887DRAFT_1289437 [Amanita rubescens]
MLDFVDDDILDPTSSDTFVYAQSDPDRNKMPPITFILQHVVESAPDKLDQKFRDSKNARDIVKEYSSDHNGDENSNLTKLLNWCWQQGTFKKIRCLKILRPMSEPEHQGQTLWEKRKRFHLIQQLGVAYSKPFVGNAATDFVKFLHDTDNDIRSNKLLAYAKIISVLQSSGMGKSRMLTEVGNHIFTLPICLRHPASPGYPPSDEGVYSYFARITAENDTSFTAHIAIASFLTAVHEVILKWLKEALEQFHFDKDGLRAWWHGIMEEKSGRKSRRQFFSEVLNKANIVSHRLLMFQSSHWQIKLEAECPGSGPQRPNDKNDLGHDIVATSLKFYQGARVAVEALMEFLTNLYRGEQPLCVTYFDETHELEMRFWILLRLLSHQPKMTRMWYVFVGTKSYFTPPSQDLRSLRLAKEMRKLLLPYIALHFDNKGVSEVATIGELQSHTHLASYGRPLWRALLPEEGEDDMIYTASLKLINGEKFNDKSLDHVFTVLSQRLCLEPVVVNSEAIALADRSVANHMRLVTGISDDRRTLYTYSPSEPILVLGAVDILHDPKDDKLLGRVLDTFSKRLCSTGLVEKGLIGELGARILLLLARDFAAPMVPGRGRNLLSLVPLLTVIDTLFGNTTWAGEHRTEYDKAFGAAHVNFTHWIVTKDPLPEKADQDLLANLWARGAILQCCFNQESVDFMMIVYYGDIDAEAIFNPAKLSAVFGQVKFKSQADTTAEQAIRPIGLPRSLSGPLPYLAMLFELGNDSNHGRTKSKIKVTTPTSTMEDEFPKFTQKLTTAVEALDKYRAAHPEKKRKKDPELVEKENQVEEERAAKDAYNRYTIAIRGASASVYGILDKAKVETEFATLLAITMPSPTVQDEMIQRMRPLERLGRKCGHTAWMSTYVVGESMMDVDSGEQSHHN